MEQELVIPSKVVQEADKNGYGTDLTQKVKIALIAHFVNAIPIERLNLSTQQKENIALVDHVYWLYKANPFLDIHAMFFELCKNKYKSRQNGGNTDGRAFIMSRMFERMLDFVLDNTNSFSRKKDEMQVRYAANRLMQRGLATDNGRDLAKGADLLTRVARLDQPESEQVDMGNLMFLPPVVVTNVKEIDETKDDMDDAEMQRIMQKYGGYVDEKIKDINEMVAVMEAGGQSNEPDRKQSE